MKRFNKIAIVGVGLIGGSIGLAVKAGKLAGEVVGIGHRKSSIDKAVSLKAIDWGTVDFAKGVERADMVILATPILLMRGIADRIAPHLKKGCIITDVGSAKLMLVQELEGIMPEGVNFVGGHPMAGSEKRGVERARKDLFKGSISILTRTRKTDARSLRAVKELWENMGSKVVIISPEAHDRIISQVSHLPHMVIFSMLNSIDNKNLRFASSGFYDATRIASSEPGIWKDIAISNRNEILKSISKFKKSLSLLEEAIKNEDSAALLRIFRNAKNKREFHNF